MSKIQLVEKIEKDDRITILMLSWRDIKNPLMGGAEIYTHEVLKRMNPSKYRVLHFSPQVEGCPDKEIIEGVQYFRRGTIATLIMHAFLFYKKNRTCIDYVVDQCNTFRFFTPFWVKKEKRIFLIFQLCRELWSIMSKFPLSLVGRVMETPMLKLNRGDYAITESESVRQELLGLGYDKNKLSVIPIGLDFEPWSKERFLPKEENPVFIYVGRCVRYKGIHDMLSAFGKVKKDYPNAKVWIVGNCKDEMLKGLLPIIEENQLSYGKELDNDIVFWGFVSEEKKLELQSRATALVFPSLREGWGIIVTEAAAVGTPSIVYNSTGCSDAVNYGKAGYLCKQNTVDELYNQMISVIEDKETYEKMREAAHEFSKEFSWDGSAKMFENKISIIRDSIAKEKNK